MSSNLVHSPADVVWQLLIDGGQATDPADALAWPVFVGVEPDTPDNCLTLDDTTGASDGRDMADGTLNQHFGLQLRVRSVGAPNGWVKAQTMRAWLSEQVRMTLVNLEASTYEVACLSKFGQVLKLGTDAPSSKRWLHTLNFFASIRQL